ncbi:MAG TPA: TAXI family TRAP transporter solute-binding subunit, partial [Casimicrobiaceae bacterium]|nr:TAXI family TRAP transporter solute-binding subunit [Casimicrobiaceae bacterium]
MSFIQRRLALATLAAALVVPALATAQDRVFFGIATGGTGGTYYPLGGMLAQLISNKVVLGGKKLS